MLLQSTTRQGAAAVLIVLASGTVAHGQVSTYTVGGNGYTSLDRGVTQMPFDITQTNLPGGGEMVAGGGRQEIRVSGSSAVIPLLAGGSGGAIAKPGSLGASAHGLASVAGETSPGMLGAHVLGNFSASSTEYIPITGTMPMGSVVNFTSSYHVNGVTSSEQPSTGPYQYSGFNYPTGTFFFMFTAYTVNGTTQTYNGDAVGSGTYSFPNGLFTAIPTALNFGQTFDMTGKVGDYLVLVTTLGLGVQDRAYDGFGGFQESHLDFSNTVNLFADAVTPGLSFVANGHNYASSPVPVPPSALLLLSAGASLIFWRGRRT